MQVQATSRQTAPRVVVRSDVGVIRLYLGWRPSFAPLYIVSPTTAVSAVGPSAQPDQQGESCWRRTSVGLLDYNSRHQWLQTIEKIFLIFSGK